MECAPGGAGENPTSGGGEPYLRAHAPLRASPERIVSVRVSRAPGALQLDGETSGAKMNRTIVSQLARTLLVGICVAAVLNVVVRVGHAVLGSGRSFGVLL